MYSNIQPQRLYEQIVAQIQALIFDGKLQAGDQLPAERELAEQFGVSRTAVREAIKSLHEKGLVEIRPGRGTFITDGTTQASRSSLSLLLRINAASDMSRLVQVRTLLEPGIAEIAAQKATSAEIQKMQEAIEIMDASMTDATQFVEADLAFHLALAQATQNPLIPILVDPLIDSLREHRMRIFLVPGGPQRGQFHHKRIYETIITHDPDAARRVMLDHLQQVADDSKPID